VWVATTLALAPVLLAVRFDIFARHYRKPETEAALWGFLFGLFLWAFPWAVGLGLVRSVIFGAVGGLLAGLFAYSRGAALDNPPAARPWRGVQRRLAARQSR
jgi:hypothetical protein